MRPEFENDYCQYVADRMATMRRFAYLVCGDWHRAEDVVQSAFIKVYLSWSRVSKADSPDAYTRRIILNCLNDVWRRHWFKRDYSGLEFLEPVDASDQSGDIERHIVLDALSELPTRRRATLVLRYWEDLSVDQTAAVMRCSPATVKSQTVQGLRTLRGLLSGAFHESVERASR